MRTLRLAVVALLALSRAAAAVETARLEPLTLTPTPAAASALAAPAVGLAAPESVLAAPQALEAPPAAQAAPAPPQAEAAPSDAGEAAATGGEKSFLEAIGAYFAEQESEPDLAPGRGGFGPYAQPNELRPCDARRVLAESPSGVYVSVGTSRGFAGAALSDASHLLLLDSSAGIVAHNRITVAMLELAKDRRDFLSLRVDPAAARFAETRRLSPASRRALADAGAVALWQRAEQTSALQPGARSFAGANYLSDDVLFGRLKRLADRGRIRAIQVDLGDAQDVRLIAEGLRREGTPVGTLYVSNAWQRLYLDERGFSRLVEAFQPAASPKSVVLVTLQFPNRPVPRGMRFDWDYFGFRFGDAAAAQRPWRALYERTSVLSRHRLNALDGPAGSWRRAWNRASFQTRASWAWLRWLSATIRRDFWRTKDLADK